MTPHRPRLSRGGGGRGTKMIAALIQKVHRGGGAPT